MLRYNLPFVNATNGKLHIAIVYGADLSVASSIDDATPVVAGNYDFYSNYTVFGCLSINLHGNNRKVQFRRRQNS